MHPPLLLKSMIKSNTEENKAKEGNVFVDFYQFLYISIFWTRFGWLVFKKLHLLPCSGNLELNVTYRIQGLQQLLAFLFRKSECKCYR